MAFDRKAYNGEYLKQNLRQFMLKVNKKTDPEMVAWLEGQESVQTYLKDLIRADMAKHVPVSEDVRAFVASLILSSTESRDPMTVEDAVYNMQEWQNEGIEVPADLSPETLSRLWNDGIK